MTRSARRDRRVTLALKWSLLDDCSPKEIQQRFIENGHGEYALSTIRDYLSEEESQDVSTSLPRSVRKSGRGRSTVTNASTNVLAKPKRSHMSATRSWGWSLRPQ